MTQSQSVGCKAKESNYATNRLAVEVCNQCETAGNKCVTSTDPVTSPAAAGAAQAVRLKGDQCSTNTLALALVVLSVQQLIKEVEEAYGLEAMMQEARLC